MNRKQKSISGAILLFVLGMLMVLSFLVTAFLQNLHQDLRLRMQLEGKENLRHTAYNVVEAIRCHIEQQLTLGEIISSMPSVDWMQLPPSIHVKISLEDESGKIPLHGSDEKQLTNLFRLFADVWDARTLAQSYLRWLQEKPIPVTLIDSRNQKNPTEKDSSQTMEETPKTISLSLSFPKALNHYHQLQEIEKFRTLFFDKNGNPNDKLKRLQQCTSLHTHYPVNLNAASKDVLQVLSKTFSLNVDAITSYLGLQPNATESHRYTNLQDIQKLGHGRFSSTTSSNEEAYAYQKMLTTRPHLLHLQIVIIEGKLSFSLQVLWAIQEESKKGKKSRSTRTPILLKLIELKENE